MELGAEARPLRDGGVDRGAIRGVYRVANGVAAAIAIGGKFRGGLWVIWVLWVVIIAVTVECGRDEGNLDFRRLRSGRIFGVPCRELDFANRTPEG